MKAARVVLGAVVAAVALCPQAWTEEEAPAAEESLENVVRARQDQIEKKLTVARDRMQHKNFVAARSAIGDASKCVDVLQGELPPQKIYVRLTSIERHVKAGRWAEAKAVLEAALRELDAAARYIDVTKIWQHLDEVRGSVADRRGGLALQEVRAAQRFAYLDEIATPLRRAQVHMSDARRELLKLPTFFKGKRTAATRRLDLAEEELGRAYAEIDKLLAGEYATGGIMP